MEIVENGCGILYARPEEDCLGEALRSLDVVRHLVEPDLLMTHAAGFSESVFRSEFLNALARLRSPGGERGRRPQAKPTRVAAD
jgi:hypothetical protein